MISGLKNGITRDRHTTYLFPHPFRKKDIRFYPKRGKLSSFQLGEKEERGTEETVRPMVFRFNLRLLVYLKLSVSLSSMK